MSIGERWQETIKEAAAAKGCRFGVKHVNGKEIVQVGDPNGRYLELVVATRALASPAEAEFVAATHPRVALLCTASDAQQAIWTDTTDDQRQLDALVTWVVGGPFDPRVLPTTTAT